MIVGDKHLSLRCSKSPVDFARMDGVNYTVTVSYTLRDDETFVAQQYGDRRFTVTQINARRDVGPDGRASMTYLGLSGPLILKDGTPGKNKGNARVAPNQMTGEHRQALMKAIDADLTAALAELGGRIVAWTNDHVLEPG